MPDPTRCSKCNKPLTLSLPPGGKGRRAMRCLDCENPDPIRLDQAAGWFAGPLKPPRQR
jgi:hypothetical protein